MIYHETEHGTLYRGDCLDIMTETLNVRQIADLVIADPPYNIRKAEWDKWDSREEYVSWLGDIVSQLTWKMKPNGSFYMFHNDIPQMAMLVEWIRRHTELIFKQMVVWNKRFDGSPNKGYMDGCCAVSGLRNYQKLAEYLLYYTFQDQTGLTTVMLDTNNFSTLRQYFKDYQEALGLTLKQITDKVGRKAEHCFYWGSTQWNMPTPETYAELGRLPINGEFVRREYEDLRREYEDLRREYEDLRREYEDLRYTFNNQKTHHNVWNYDFAPKQGHITPKPVELMENIIRHSSNKGDTVLDPFAGSGTTAIACIRLGRKYILIEKEEKYCEIAVRRIESELDQTTIDL